MIDTKSIKFNSLSKESKILLLSSIVNDKQLTFSQDFCEIIGLKYPEDEFTFIYYLTEINNSKIDYRLNKIKFIAPTLQEIDFFLQLMQNKLKKSLTLSEINSFANYFYDFYSKNNWKIKNKKMIDWKQHCIFAINNWKINAPKQGNVLDEIHKAFH